MSNAWDEKSVYLTALSLRVDDREAFLRGACPTAEARARIERLLAQSKAEPDTPTFETPPATIGIGGAAPGTMLDEFRILREIGRGGMGTVYLAEDMLLHREVAVKILAAHLVGSERALARFRDEARNAAGLRHPSIVPVYKLGTDSGLHYIVSEYVEGTTLSAALEAERARRKGTSDSRRWQKQAAQIAASIADALDCSHRAGILHRDVKPSNILLDKSGAARLTDFGIAKRVAPGEEILHTQAIGTCHYMSPEQASVEDARIDQRSDVFSLGAVLYEMLTLRRAFEGTDANLVLKAVMSDDPTKVRAIDASIPRDLETICHKALEKLPERRYQSAAHMGADLRAFLSGLPILARPPGIARRLGSFSSRHKVPLAIGAFLTLGLGLLFSWNRMNEAHSASMAWVSIESEKTPLRVLIQRCDEATLELSPLAKDAGSTPIREMKLNPGQYRITVATADGSSFAEFNAVLLWPGQANEVRLRVASADAEEADGSSAGGGKQSSSQEVPQGLPVGAHPGRSLSARLVRTEAVVQPMVAVDAGKYAFGWAQVTDPLMGARTVELPRFFIDRTKVSNREYGAFLDATGRAAPPHWKNIAGRDELADLPVANVSLEDAEAFARWSGKRLPTMFEWQAAMRGPTGARYPTGDKLPESADSLEPSQAVLLAEQSWDAESLFKIYEANCRPVHTPDPFATASGLMHSFDSVRELCANIAFPRQDVVMQGRAWSESVRFADLTRTRTTPFMGYSLKSGFRCAKSAAPPVVTQ